MVFGQPVTVVNRVLDTPTKLYIVCSYACIRTGMTIFWVNHAGTWNASAG